MKPEIEMAAQTTANQAFEAAVHTNMGRLMALARAMLGTRIRDAKQAEDIVQDALLNLFRHRHEYDWSEGGWPLMAKAVARNVISCRRRKVGQSLDVDSADYASLEIDNDPVEAAITAETVRYFRGLIDALPESWRQAMVLREQQGMGYREIARMLNASEAQIKTWLHRARRHLMQAWRNQPAARCRRVEQMKGQ